MHRLRVFLASTHRVGEAAREGVRWTLAFAAMPAEDWVLGRSDLEKHEAVPGESGERQWYSVAEAAAYLGVSQPTIFRWMKENLISFYKVGGATRFSRAGLDAMIEKQTGRKEAEAAHGQCAACGNNTLVEGTVQAFGQTYFVPDKVKFGTLREGGVPIRVKVCAGCGFLNMYGDIDKLRDLLPANLHAGGDEPEIGSSHK